jgi:NAD(P)H dehydrogenase (quinone)
MRSFMTNVIMVYTSKTGNTEKMARTIAEGAKKAEDVNMVLVRAKEVNIENLADMDGYAFGSPNTFGGIVGELRAFFDRAWSVRDKMTGKPVVAFTSENPDTRTALEDAERFFNYYKLVKAADGVVAVKTPSETVLDACKSLGQTLAERSKKHPQYTTGGHREPRRHRNDRH